MGIKEFLRRTKLEKKKHISAYKNKKVGIDAYSWIHKGLYTCGEAVFFKNDISNIVSYFRSKINKLLSFNISCVLVFDGDNLSLKNNTEEERKESRKKVEEKIRNLKNLGQNKDAKRLYSSAIDVTPEMAYVLKIHLEKEFQKNLEFIVAPYEADSQLAYLSKIGYIDFVISEDSDLLIFGAKTIFYKMDHEYNGEEVELSELKNCKSFDFSDWTHDEVIQFAITCGCDYLASPKGMKFVNAYKVFSKTRRISDFLEEMEGKLEMDYYKKFVCAYLSFKYQNVYCPIQKKMRTLNDFDKADNPHKLIALEYFKSYSFLGGFIEQKVLSRLVNFEIDPITKTEYPRMSKYVVKRGGSRSKKRKTASRSFSPSFGKFRQLQLSESFNQKINPFSNSDKVKKDFSNSLFVRPSEFENTSNFEWPKEKSEKKYSWNKIETKQIETKMKPSQFYQFEENSTNDPAITNTSKESLNLAERYKPEWKYDSIKNALEFFKKQVKCPKLNTKL